jgi:hypothetical protein
MKNITILILCIGFFSNSFCQNEAKSGSDSCVKFLDHVSYFWRLDSLGQNGFRLYAYNILFDCKFEKLTVSKLLEKLGKPNFVEKSTRGTHYCYYYYDGRYLPKEADLTQEVGYLSFTFDSGSNYLSGIGKGHID